METGMFKNLGKVLEQVSRDKGIPLNKLVEAVEAAFLTAARKKWGHLGELEAHYNDEMGEIELFQFKSVVDEITDQETQMNLKDAKELDPEAQLGDSIGVKMDPSVFGRIAAQAAKQVIIQKMRDAERDITLDEYKDRVGEVVTGIIRRFERGDIVIDLGRSEAVLQKAEQVPGENYRAGERVQAYFLRVDPESRGPIIILSRKDTRFVTKLFEVEVPEISEGIVEIRAAARDPGMRTKIAVYSRDGDVDPVGACVGVKGSRVQNIVSELKGEKVDIIAWDPDPARFVCNAVSPAEVVKVIIKEREHTMEVIVPDDQLSLAIGRRGHNVRLAAELTGWNIDVYSESKIDNMARRSRIILARVLAIDDTMTIVLYSHTYRTVEDIAKASKEQFFEIPGVEKSVLEDIYEKAAKAVADGVSSEALIAQLIKDEEEQVQKFSEKKEPASAEEKAAQPAPAATEEEAAGVDWATEEGALGEEEAEEKK